MNTPLGGSERERFTVLFEAHFADIWRYARRRSDSAATADDITSQVFAVAWRRRHELPYDDARLWLFGVARNTVFNERRSSNRLHRLRAKLASRPHESPARAQDPAGAPAFEVDQVEQSELPLASLTPRELEAVRLRYWDELSVTDIAVLLGCSANAVSMRLHKARQKLADQLATGDPQRTKDSDGPGHVGTAPTAGVADTGKDDQR